MSTRKHIRKDERATNHGINVRALALGEVERIINLSVPTYNAAPISPAKRGERTQEMMIPPRPAIDQSTHAVETAAIVMPTTPPTIAWVPDTGRLPKVARRLKAEDPMRAENIPTA
mmetsp:Transcript_23411/g.36774  ORF Transcript_23411/g.36774 Transcript_23411/m.36774 type:complete len:116 (-) Transcript_23411:469-816(-)